MRRNWGRELEEPCQALEGLVAFCLSGVPDSTIHSTSGIPCGCTREYFAHLRRMMERKILDQLDHPSCMRR